MAQAPSGNRKPVLVKASFCKRWDVVMAVIVTNCHMVEMITGQIVARTKRAGQTVTMNKQVGLSDKAQQTST
jgi:hypothetical protein